MPELEEIVHRLPSASVIIAADEIEIVAFEFVVDNDDRMTGRLEFIDEAVMVVETQQQRTGRPAVFKQADMLSAADEFSADPLEEHIVPHRRGLLGDPANQLAEV